MIKNFLTRIILSIVSKKLSWTPEKKSMKWKLIFIGKINLILELIRMNGFDV
jgi:hypothetical protein